MSDSRGSINEVEDAAKRPGDEPDPNTQSPSKKIKETKSDASITPPSSQEAKVAPSPSLELPLAPPVSTSLTIAPVDRSPLLSSNAAMTQELKALSKPTIDLSRATSNQTFTCHDRVGKDLIPLYINDTLPGVEMGTLLSNPIPPAVLSFGSEDDQQQDAIRQLRAAYGAKVGNARHCLALYAKGDELVADPYIFTLMPDCRPVGSRVIGNFLASEPTTPEDGMYAYVVVKRNGVYHFVIARAINGDTNHMGMFGSEDGEKFAVGEIYIKSGKVVLMNDKTGSSYVDVMKNAAKLGIEDPYKLALEHLIPAKCRTPDALYHWNRETAESVERMVVAEVLSKPLGMLRRFFEANTELFLNRNEQQCQLIENGIKARLLQVLAEPIAAEKSGQPQPLQLLQPLALQAVNLLLGDYALSLKTSFPQIPDLRDLLRVASSVLGNIKLYHPCYNDRLLHNKLVDLGFTKEDKIYIRTATPPEKLACIPEMRSFAGKTPAPSPIDARFFSSTSSLTSSSSAVSPLLPPKSGHNTPSL